MGIGELLQHYRKSNGVTQKHFAQGVLSESYYSKVENGMHRISAEDLFALLTKNHINYTEFMDRLLLSNEVSYIKQLEKRMYRLYYENDFNRLFDLSNEANSSNLLTEEEKESFSALIEAVMATKNLSKLTSTEKKILKSKILEAEDWTDESMALFASVMHIYDFEDIVFFVLSILRKNLTYQFDDRQSIKGPVFASILLNFLAHCFKENELSLVYKPLAILKRLPNTPEYVFYRIITRYYVSLFEVIKDKQTVEQSVKDITTIIDLFKLIDSKNMATSLEESVKANLPMMSFEDA